MHRHLNDIELTANINYNIIFIPYTLHNKGEKIMYFFIRVQRNLTKLILLMSKIICIKINLHSTYYINVVHLHIT